MRVLICTADDAERQKLENAFEAAGWAFDSVADRSDALQKVAYVAADLLVAECEPDLREVDDLIRTFQAKNAGTLAVILIVSLKVDEELDLRETLALGAEAVFRRRIEAGAVVKVAERLTLAPEERVKRRHDRAVCAFPVVYRDHLTRKLNTSKVINLSISGTYVEVTTDVFPERFDVVSFAFRIEPEGWEVAGKGVVQWVRKEANETIPSGFSIEFFDLTDLDHQHLTDWVKVNVAPSGPREFEIE